MSEAACQFAKLYCVWHALHHVQVLHLQPSLVSKSSLSASIASRCSRRSLQPSTTLAKLTICDLEALTGLCQPQPIPELFLTMGMACTPPLCTACRCPKNK